MRLLLKAIFYPYAIFRGIIFLCLELAERGVLFLHKKMQKK